MRIRVHPETTDGKPIPGNGTVLAADTPAALVELMRLQTPFSAEMSAVEYCDEVLLHVEGSDRRPLPDDRAAAAIEFLTRLAQHARIEFLPDDAADAESEQAEPQEDDACVGK